jgi:hypothetical protein
VKSIFRFVCVLLTIGGWGLAALCLHVVRTPDPDNPQQSKLVMIPKNRLGVSDTYVDAREWKMADVSEHGTLIRRVLDADKADEFKYLADPKSKEDIKSQLTDALSNARTSPTTARAAAAFSWFSH